MVAKTDAVTLSEIRAGESAVVLDFSNGNGIAGRLTSLGFTPGVEVQMTQNFGRGPLIVTVRGTRVALGRGEAIKICVERRLE
ncbi:MAG: ferrous iron transport protein A [Anaerolineae bacterium]|nr:ferrous iron transport protein A [Anaerolineae bacterium]